MKVYSVLIIGAGKIGAFFDTPQGEQVLTHAHAFTSHPGFKLLGFVDADRNQAERAAAVWGGDAFSTISGAFAQQVVDVAVVAVPDELHYPLLKDLVAYQPKLVFAEKPLTKRLIEAEEIVHLYRERGVSLGVNYTRRFVPEFVTLRDEIKSGAFGRFLTGTGYYGKGTLHNGSHLIDLLRFMLGEIAATRTISKIHDFFEDDPSCSAVLDLADGGEFVMQAVDCRSYTVFEMDLLFEKKRVRLVDAGFSIEDHEIRENTMFAGYRNPVLSQTIDTGLKSAFSQAVALIYAQLSSGDKFCCSGDDALLTHKVCLSILEGQQ